MAYQIKTQLITSSSRPKQALKPQGIVLHDTDTPGATADSERKYFQNQAPGASAHVFVDWEQIVQIIPFNEKAWHAGPTANKRYIGIELCCPKSHDVNLFNKVWSQGVWLFAFIYKYVIKVDKVTDDNFWTHAKISNTFHETDHEDPVAYFKEYGKTPTDFKNDVQKLLGGGVIEVPVIKYNPFPRTMKIGNNGSDVKTLQSSLNKILKPDPKYKIAENGEYTAAFAEVVKKFQQKYFLKVDGIAGDATLSKVKEILKI